MAKLSNITPGIALVKEKIKATSIVRVGINAMGLVCIDTEDEKLKSDIICALNPAKGLFLSNPRAVCEISVIDESFSGIYRVEKRFCITNSMYIDPQQISAACGLPFTPSIRILLTPKMVLDIQAIMCGRSNTNICDYLKFTSNALSVSGTPIYGLTVNGVFVKDRRASIMTRIPDEQWSMSDTYKDIVWKSLVSIAYNYIQKNQNVTIDALCELFINTYGSNWITKLIVFNNNTESISLPGFMTKLASSSISSEQLVNAYQLMVAILKGKFQGVHKMDRDEASQYIKNMQNIIAEKINSNIGNADDFNNITDKDSEKKSEEDKKEEPKEKSDKDSEKKSEEDKKEEPKEKSDKDSDKDSEKKSEEDGDKDSEKKSEEDKKEEPKEKSDKDSKKKSEEEEDNESEENADEEEEGDEDIEL